MELALLEDRLGEGERLHLDAAHRVVYAVYGAVDVEAGGSRASIGENATWHGAGPCVIHARAAARLWRWELRADGMPRSDSARTALKLSHAIEMPASEDERPVQALRPDGSDPALREGVRVRSADRGEDHPRPF